MTWLYNLLDWIADHLPTQCANCSAWTIARNTHSVTHRVAGSVPVCQKCYHELYG
jgi:hypothetical protein